MNGGPTIMASMTMALTLGAFNGAARAEPGRFGLELGLEVGWYPTESVAYASDDVRGAQGLIALSYQPIDLLTVYAGWRHLGPLARADSLAPNGAAGADGTDFAFETQGDAIVAGARLTLPIIAGLSFVGELDLEALHVGTRVTLDGQHADTGAWAPGAVPKVGLAYHVPLDDCFALDFRVMAGYALRLDHDLDPVVLGPDPSVRTQPTDLGPLNLSGPVLAGTVALTF